MDIGLQSIILRSYYFLNKKTIINTHFEHKKSNLIGNACAILYLFYMGLNLSCD